MTSGVRGIYKPEKSPYWWARFTRDGKLIRKSLQTTDIDLAKERLRNIKNDRRGDDAPQVDIMKRLGKIKERAVRLNVPFDLTKEELQMIFARSGNRCELTGIEFSQEREIGWSKAPFGPSVDRISRAKGYTAKNCRLICHAVNVAINEWGEGVLERIAISYLSKKAGKLS